MGDFEFEFQKKTIKIREQLNKKEVDIKGKLAEIQKIKLEALKRTEEMKYSAQHDLEKITQDLMKAKELGADVKTKLSSEITDLKNEIERKYSEIKDKIAEKPSEIREPKAEKTEMKETIQEKPSETKESERVPD